MPAVVIDLATAEDTRDVVHRAVQALAEGKLVALPTETVYGIAASAVNEKAVERLSAIKSRGPGHPFTLALKSADEAIDYVPHLPPIAQRLTRRCWPGPITLVVEDDHPDSLLRQLPASVRQAVSPNGTIGLRVPGHELVLSILRLTTGPLALTSANHSGQPDAVTAQEVVQSLGNDVDLIIDDGRSRFGQPSSVVRVFAKGWQMLRAGVLDEKALKRLVSVVVVFVCSGNTCRSPMAESMFRRRAAERLGCGVDELEERGLIITSAGTSAQAGVRASAESVQIMREHGLDLMQHESQQVNERLMRFADLILTMTQGHRDQLLGAWPEIAPRVHLLSCDGDDIADPIGGPIEYYRRCAQQIDACLESWLPRLDELGAFDSAKEDP